MTAIAAHPARTTAGRARGLALLALLLVAAFWVASCQTQPTDNGNSTKPLLPFDNENGNAAANGNEASNNAVNATGNAEGTNAATNSDQRNGNTANAPHVGRGTEHGPDPVRPETNLLKPFSNGAASDSATAIRERLAELTNRLDANPQDEEARRLLVLGSLFIGDSEHARRALQSIPRDQRHAWRDLFQLAGLGEELGDAKPTPGEKPDDAPPVRPGGGESLAEVAARLKVEVVLKPDDIPTRRQLVFVLLALGRTDEAKEQLFEVSEKNWDSFHDLLKLAAPDDERVKVLVAKEREKAAGLPSLADLEARFKADPTDDAVARQLVIRYVLEERFLDALEVLPKVSRNEFDSWRDLMRLLVEYMANEPATADAMAAARRVVRAVRRTMPLELRQPRLHAKKDWYRRGDRLEIAFTVEGFSLRPVGESKHLLEITIDMQITDLDGKEAVWTKEVRRPNAPDGLPIAYKFETPDELLTAHDINPWFRIPATAPGGEYKVIVTVKDPAKALFQTATATVNFRVTISD